VRTGFKCRAYPTPEQQAILSRTFGCVRLVWNRTLAWRQARWRDTRTKTSFVDANAYLTALKRDPQLAFLSEVSSVPLQQAIRTQQTAFTNFYAKRARHPRFKSRAGRQAAEYTRSGFRWRDGKLWLAKMDMPPELVWSWPHIDPSTVDPSTVTVSRDPDGRWYVSLFAEVPEPTQLPPTGSTVGVDLGIADFAVLSIGQRIANPRHLPRKARNLARYQRRLARCRPGSNNRAKAKAKVARAHRKVRCARADFLHKTSTGLVREHDVIVIEDLAVANMIRNRRLAKHIADASWGQLRRQLEYKSARYGRHLIVLDRWYPSSKTCSACGHLLDRLDLSTRTWTCPDCGTLHDRDHNAAKNILAAGLAVTACGADVRHSGSPRVRSAVKQEPQPAKVGIPGALALGRTVKWSQSP
jgi:putative transposase